VEVCIVGFFDFLRDGFAEPGTTARLNGELGAKTPQSCKSIESDWTGVSAPALRKKTLDYPRDRDGEIEQSRDPAQ
jgi:hypothetical protein